ncbi:hypothetical protein ACFY93_16055 [Streptomyces sp. NPDC008313]|uniref:hypothetical protein n=1 Tax=Streptomyces sp. NPDC008313 TaxID=3364826 RepID=UPI0036E53526
MAKPPTAPDTIPDSVWLTRGRHVGPAPQDILREHLRALRAGETIESFLEVEPSTHRHAHVFEARWRAVDGITVRARLTLDAHDGADAEWDWVLAAEADLPWDPSWPSPATVFWPDRADVSWDHDAVAGLRLRDTNALPQDDKVLRRLLKECAQQSWSINVVVHEAMTPDERGRLPLARLLPPGLRHRVVEHRAAPERFQAVNWALYDLGVRVPRGGAVILPCAPAPSGFDVQDFTVRSVFLDGSEPAELLGKIVEYAALPRPLPDRAREPVTALRDNWHLWTVEEQLAHARAQVEAYAEALEAMTRSRDLYREAAELAHAALAESRSGGGAALPALGGAAGREGSPLRRLTQTFQRWNGGAGSRRIGGGRDDDPTESRG